MHDSKLIDVFKTLESNDLKQLNRYIHSPFLNENEDVATLFEYIRQYAYKLDTPALTKEKAFKFIYPKKKYDESKLRYLMSYLLKVIERFFVHINFEKDTIEQKIRLAEIYASKNLPKHFNATIKLAQKLQENSEQRNGEYYHRQYRLEKLHANFLSQKQNRKTEPNLQSVSDNLDFAYLINKLEQSCFIYNYQNLVKTDYKIHLLDEALAHIEHTPERRVPAIDLYYQTLLTLRNSDEEKHFFELKELLQQFNTALPKSEMQGLHVLARNYCIKRLNRGNRQFIQELFDLYEIGLEKGLLLEEDHISPWTYKNIVAVGAKLHKFEWTEKFIHNYKDLLPDQYKESMFTFNLAKLHFEKQEYNEVITLLHQTEIKDLLLNLNAKTMLAITYYELDETEVLASLLDSFRIYLLRKKGLGYHKDLYLNFIRFTKKLLALNPFNNINSANKIYASVKSTRVLAERVWLIKKLEDMGAELPQTQEQ